MNQEIMSRAFLSGQLETAKWAYSQGAKMNGLSLVAATKGRLDFLEWIFEMNEEIHESSANLAAAGNHIETVEWLAKHGIPVTEFLID